MISKMTDLDMFFHICVVKILSHPSHVTPVKIPLSFTVREKIYKLNKELITEEPNSIKLMEKKVLDITKPHYSEQSNLPVPWPLILSSSTVPNQKPTIKLLFLKKGKQKAS